MNVFDYRTMTVSQSETGDMAYARWYGTPVTLANGKILQLGGTDGRGAGVGVPELYTPGTGWEYISGTSKYTVANDINNLGDVGWGELGAGIYFVGLEDARGTRTQRVIVAR